jgi:hypothetical protein
MGMSTYTLEQFKDYLKRGKITNPSKSNPVEGDNVRVTFPNAGKDGKTETITIVSEEKFRNAFQNGVARTQHALGDARTVSIERRQGGVFALVVTSSDGEFAGKHTECIRDTEEECKQYAKKNGIKIENVMPERQGEIHGTKGIKDNPFNKGSKEYDAYEKGHEKASLMKTSNARQRGISNAYSSIQYGGRVKELLAKGMTAEEIAKDTGYPLHAVELTIKAVRREDGRMENAGAGIAYQRGYRDGETDREENVSQWNSTIDEGEYKRGYKDGQKKRSNMPPSQRRSK